MDINNIQLIDQRLAHLRSLIPICKALSAAADKRLADLIIILEIKRIEAINALEKRLGELRALIPVYKARCFTYEHVLSKQIIDLDLQPIAAKAKIFSSHRPSAHLFELYSPAPQPPAPQQPLPQPFAPKPLQINDMAGILTERPRQIPNLYWQPGLPISVSISHFRQIKYFPLPNAVPDLDQTLLAPGSIVLETFTNSLSSSLEPLKCG